MQKVFDYIEQHQMIQTNDKIIVGVSGGADSLCLLFVLRAYSRKVPFSILAVHVEHGIRGGESLADEAFTARLCREYAIPYRCVSCSAKEKARREKMTLEEAARAERYRIFEELRKETGATKIAVAHNQNDQAETVLFRMARGSGLAGAAGMYPVRENIIRPLLGCSRDEIESYLRSHDIAWRTDSTNDDTAYARNYLRKCVLPQLCVVNAGATAHLAQLAQELQQVQQYLEPKIAQMTQECAVCAPGSIRIDIGRFSGEPELLQEYCLRACLKSGGCGMKDFRREHISAVRALCTMQSGKRITLPGGWAAERSFGTLHIMLNTAQDTGKRRQKADERESDEGKARQTTEMQADAGGSSAPDAEAFEMTAPVPGICETPQGTFELRVFAYKSENISQKTYTKWFDYDKISNDLCLRTRRAGDYLVIDGRGGRKKLKQYLIEEKIPARERENILLFAQGSEVLWVVGHRISEAYKVLPGTKKILEIQKIGEEDGGENCKDIIVGRRSVQES